MMQRQMRINMHEIYGNNKMKKIKNSNWQKDEKLNWDKIIILLLSLSNIYFFYKIGSPPIETIILIVITSIYVLGSVAMPYIMGSVGNIILFILYNN